MESISGCALLEMNPEPGINPGSGMDLAAIQSQMIPLFKTSFYDMG
ncbi:MAG: hypothetical protein ACPG70_08685 [Candidatus Puniceispirillaceae bacterium]